MKRIFLMATAAIVSAQITMAKDKSGEECKAELATIVASRDADGQPAYAKSAFLANQQGGVQDLKGCKNITYKFTNIQGQLVYIDNKVYVTADGTSIIVQNNQSKALSLSLIPGSVTDFAVMAGRLIITTADHKVLVVGRNGDIFEMLTGSGKSYQEVKSIEIDNGILVMAQEKNGEIKLTEEQVTKRINEAGKFRSVSF